MARFSGKIHSAKFVDSSEKTIEVLYGDNPAKLSSWYLQVDYNNQDFLDFVAEVDLDTVGDVTHEFYETQRNAYDIEIEAKASQLAVEMAEKMFHQWMDNTQKDIKQEYDNIEATLKEEYKKVNDYKEQQLRIAQEELEEQYKQVEDYKEQQLRIAQEELKEQYKEVEDYRRNQLAILQEEFEEQIKERYKQADAYALEQAKILEQQLEDRTREVEQNYKEQEKALAKTAEQIQAELDYAERVAERVELEKQKTEQDKKKLADERSDMLKKFRQGLNLPEKSSADLTGDDFVNMVMEKNENEDFLFKAKITLFNREEVKSHPDREKKMKIRKAKSIVGLLAAYNEVTEAVYEESSL